MREKRVVGDVAIATASPRGSPERRSFIELVITVATTNLEGSSSFEKLPLSSMLFSLFSNIP